MWTPTTYILLLNFVTCVSFNGLFVVCNYYHANVFVSYLKQSLKCWSPLQPKSMQLKTTAICVTWNWVVFLMLALLNVLWSLFIYNEYSVLLLYAYSLDLDQIVSMSLLIFSLKENICILMYIVLLYYLTILPILYSESVIPTFILDYNMKAIILSINLFRI